MKKAAIFCVTTGLSVMVFLAGCNSNNAPVPSTTPDMPVESSVVVAPEGAPLWAKAIQEENQLYQGLNLDGVGDSDDEAYVSTYRWGEGDSATVLCIQLGTGDVVTKIVPWRGLITLQTGRLFSNEKDAVVLEVQNKISNYGAAEVFVLDVYGANGTGSCPSIITRLDTTSGPTVLASGADLTGFDIKFGTQIVDITDESLKGLMLFHTGPQTGMRIPETIYWNGDDWALEEN